MNETKQEYLNYILSELTTIDRKDAVASYDTGYGLHVVNTKLGDSCHCMDVIGHSILRLRTPKIDGQFDLWEQAWNEGCALVRNFTKQK
jgi:hypothetical protein